MKAKNMTIRIKSLEDVLGEAKGVMKKLSRGGKEKHEGISFDSIDDMRKVLTALRLKVIKRSGKSARHPSTIWRNCSTAIRRTPLMTCSFSRRWAS